MTPVEVWKAVSGIGEAPSRLGCFSGPLLVMGGGRTVWDDYKRVEPWGGEIMAVNDIGAHFHGRIRHWVTLHPEYLAGWKHYREKHLYGHGVPAMTHSSKAKEGVDVIWTIGNQGGTSGLFACYVGLMLGYNEIVLAGIPMTDDGHYFDPPWQRTAFQDRGVALVWKSANTSVLKGRVKSLSGYTRDWLGAPNMEVAHA